MLITSLILSSAFFVVVIATLKHTARFGYLTGMVIILALLADFVFAPALMILIARGRRHLLE
jgi:predicted RND superfamily exporter protein